MAVAPNARIAASVIGTLPHRPSPSTTASAVSATNSANPTGKSAPVTEITKIIVFLGGRALPEDCRQKRYHVSRTAGFIHVLAAHDYLGILEKLRVPEDIRRYFAIVRKWSQSSAMPASS